MKEKSERCCLEEVFGKADTGLRLPFEKSSSCHLRRHRQADISDHMAKQNLNAICPELIHSCPQLLPHPATELDLRPDSLAK